jgi:transcriptional regulator with GAF, ATPase, and Fis domain
MNVNTSELSAQLDNEMKSIKLLSEIGQDITSSFSIDAIIKTTYIKVNGLMNASVFVIGIYNEKEQAMDMSGIEKGIDLPHFVYPLSEDWLSSYCFKSRKEIFITDYLNQYQNYLSENLDIKAGEEPESIIYLPLITKGNAIGVITVQAFKKDAYTQYHLSVLKIIAAYVATALENAKAYNLIESQKEEIEKKNQNLESDSCIECTVFCSEAMIA